MPTPVQFKTLTIRNFMSYGNNDTVINLEFNEPVLIIGQNLDAIVNGQIDSNGSGKTAILNALSFALYDRTISNVDKGSLINNINKKNLEVSVVFEKDGITYKIVRIRKSKTKADVRWFVGDDDKTRDSILNTNKEIERIIGLPFDVFSRIIVFSATFKPFLDLPSRHATKTNQTSIMEELFGYTELTDKAENLKEAIKGTKGEFTHLKNLQEQISLEMDRHDKQVEATKVRLAEWEEAQRVRIISAGDEIGAMSQVDFEQERDRLTAIVGFEDAVKTDENIKAEFERDIRELNDKLETAQAHRERIDNIRKKVKAIERGVDFDKEQKRLNEIATIEGEMEDTKTLLDANRKEIEDLSKKIHTIATTIKDAEDDNEKLKQELEQLGDETCPYCKQPFVDVETKTKEVKAAIRKNNGVIKSSKQDKKKLDTTVGDLTKSRNETHKELTNLNETHEEMTSGDQLSSNDLIKLQSQYDQFQIQLNSYQEIKVDDDIEEKIETAQERIDDLVKEIAKQQKLIKKTKSKALFSSVAELEKMATKEELIKERLAELIAETNPHTDTLKELKEVEFDNDKSKQLNELDDTIKHQEFLLKLLTKKDSFVRKNLLDRSLPFLNKRLMVYLEKLGLPHRVEFLPDMSARISQFGTELGFTNLSSGQAARVNLALAFAFRDILQARHGKISFCMLDECLDTGLGNVGVQLAAKMIKEIAEEDNMSMFIISHRDEIASMFESRMVVELKDGFSNIVETV